MLDLQAADTRVFMFHSADAKSDPSGAMDTVNQWLSKDRSAGAYANLRVRDITVTADGAGGIFTMIVCSLGRVVPADVTSTTTTTTAPFVATEPVSSPL